MENSTVLRELLEDGADERRNASEYYLSSVTRCMRSGSLNAG